MSLYIGSDHAGFEMKEALKVWINKEFPTEGIEDKGCETLDSCDYADYAHAVAENVKQNVLFFFFRTIQNKLLCIFVP